MKNRYWAAVVLGFLNGILWFGWSFGLVFAMWVFAFCLLAVKDWFNIRKSKGAPKLMSNQWVKMGLFFIILMLIVFVVIIPLVTILLRTIQTGRLPF